MVGILLWVKCHHFVKKNNIDFPNMDDIFVPRGRSQQKAHRVDLYYSVIDMHLQELNECFNNVNTKFLLCVACLCPDSLFSTFEKRKSIQLARYYPKDFSTI